MPSLTLSAAHARRFLVRRHLLAPPRSLPPRPESVLAVVERLGSLQFDPLEIPGARNHDLVLFARISGYHRSFCDGHLYAPRGERRLFEAYNKSLNILPAADLPYHRVSWERAAARYEKTILEKNAETVRSILQHLQEKGSLTTAAASKQFGTAIDWWWAATREGRAVLEALYACGVVGISRRDGNRRTYDLIERLFPAELLAQRVSQEASLRHRLLSRFRGVGLLGSVLSGELAYGTDKAAPRAAALAGLVADGTLVPAEVEGVRGLRYLLADERPLLEAARAEIKAPKVSFLAPLDPILWDRRLLRSLFGFDYTWEVYTPEEKRRFGHYVLPILFGDRLVGRIEPRLERREGRLDIAGIWFEEGFSPLEERAFVPAFAEALEAYRAFVGAERVRLPRTRFAAAVRAKR
ncbi:DNA glycosylase AlkZ-like family protein [Polyangium aurulentum]|uniref:DNA glycosylase AlkZ-like family protein n=1 Tax=Polyangium aurulentum TaxID=2567896 RepID=UPI00146DF616|nr:crosslink repair DNA glycosylase YcaQ family protein [Polyangium aurulentum]UQA59221.1 winged helix DNA-binding domain-containing protein [Polyangium aurulentum]